MTLLFNQRTLGTLHQSLKFLERHFNISLSEEEKKKILGDFPKPACDAVQVPRLVDQLKEHLKNKGKDPHYGSEKTLYKLQESLLDVAGPLTCLWGDLLNKDAKVSAKGILLLVQRALILLGNASHAMSQERRKVAWAKVNPKLRSLATEDYLKRGSNLFGPGFQEKASKRIELDKAMSKVSLPSSASKKRKFGRDRPDLRNFLDRGSSADRGYSLELDCQPRQAVAPPFTPPPPLEAEQVQVEISKLLNKAAVRKVSPCTGQFVSRIFTVTKKDGSCRLVVNLKPLNRFVTKKHFKMENAAMLWSLLSAHSTSGESATAAAKQGIPFSVIMKTADLARESTFQ